MRAWQESVSSIIIALWIGGIWAIGFAVFVLFGELPDHVLAGKIASVLFRDLNYFGLLSGSFLLLMYLAKLGGMAFKRGVFWCILLLWLLVIASQFGIAPIMENMQHSAWPHNVMNSLFADRFRMWHGISSVAYLIQGLLGLVIVVRV